MQKRSKVLFISTFVILLLTAILCCTLVVDVAQESAKADTSWQVRVTKNINGQYIDISSGNKITDTRNLYFLISNYGTNNSFLYYTSSSKLDTSQLSGVTSGWVAFPSVDNPDNIREIDGENYLYQPIEVENNFNKYVYFKRQYSEHENGVTVAKEEYYPNRWLVIVNTNLTANDLGIETITAKYQKGANILDYDGSWVSVAIKFEITTAWMAANNAPYNGGDELLYYSIDGKDASDNNKEWSPFLQGYNTVQIHENLNNITVYFKTTDIAGTNEAIKSYTTAVKMDKSIPTFDLSATTINTTGDIVNYGNDTWSCNDVVFTINNTSDCISDIKYYVSTDSGVNYTQLITNSYNFTMTSLNVIFRAENAAGKTYNSTNYKVKIDKITPVAKLEAYTNNPDNESLLNRLDITTDPLTNTFLAGYANGNISIKIFNKDSNGEYLNNKSPLNFYYAIKQADGSFSEYAKLSKKTTDGDFYYFTFDDIIDINTVIIDKTYKFKIVSDTGKQSEEVFISAKLVNSFFQIEVEPIEFTTNLDGWSSTPIRVYAQLPTDTKLLNGVYTIPTTQYTFWYRATAIEGAWYQNDGEYAGAISEGLSRYYFDLSASADSTFAIYATNAAGKKSANTHTTPNIIKMDVLPPQAELSVYIMPEDENFSSDNYKYIASAEWVNGRVIITLKVKIGISGVYVKELEYATHNGQPIYDSHGNLIWSELTNEMTHSQVISDDNDGSTYFIYKFEKGVPDLTVVRYSEEYRYRIYTNSGVYIDKSFVLNIDLSNIILQQIELADSVINIEDSTVTLPPVCEDFDIKLISNTEQNGHFIYYLFDFALNDYVKIESDIISVSIPMGYRGEIIKKIYLESLSQNYKGEFVRTAIEYEIVIPYDTLNIEISYELITVLEPTGWSISNTLEVAINLLKDEDGNTKPIEIYEQDNYTYYYMLINYKPNININDEIRNGTWLECARSSSAEELYRFIINLEGKSFYGYLALSVTNKAGFRSNSGNISGNIIQVDNTVPFIKDIIKYEIGEPDGNKYYSTKPIWLQQTADAELNRSTRSYYYVILNEDGTTSVTLNPESDTVLNGWTKLSGTRYFEAVNNISTTYKILIFAQNQVGNKAGGIVDGGYENYTYTLVIDPMEIQEFGNQSFVEGEGYYDQGFGMRYYEGLATINLSVTTSNTEVQYYFMRDTVGTWELYIDPTVNVPKYYPEGDIVSLIFSESYFPNGVKDSFRFMAVNRAGAICEYAQKVYILIDNVTPEFDIITTVNGLVYNGGSVDLDDTTGIWSNKPIRVQINLTNEVVSGVKYFYMLEYYNSNRQKMFTTEQQLPNNKEFTTDQLNGFDKNKDVVLTIYAKNSSNLSKIGTKIVRLKVDQVVPKFSLTGHASNDDNTASVVITSGQWTNKKNVAVTRAALVSNVSNVTYSYTYTDLDSTGVETHNWPQEREVKYSKICTITATARTDAGLTHTEVFKINIDTVAPRIRFMSNISVVENGNHFIDLKVYVEEENIKICEYITVKGETRGIKLDHRGYILSTSSVNNSILIDRETGQEYRGYVKIYVEDEAGNTAEFVLYVLPFDLDVNNITLDASDLNKVQKYEDDLNQAEVYMDNNRVVYFRNLIARLRDRIATLNNEIDTYRAYLTGLSKITSYELKTHYEEMFSYLETFNNYKVYGQAWIQDAIKGDTSSIYNAYFDNLDRAFKLLQKEMQKVEAVEKATKILPAINMVKTTDYNDILRVYDDYNNLTSDQKSVFAVHLYNKLTTLKKTCEILLLTDEGSGIRLDGDFAPGAKISVNNYSAKTETHINAQKALLSTIENNGVRAVVSVNRIALTGATSQTSTGKVSVVLPIPEEYQQYIRFAVYKLSEDGSVTEVDQVTIAGDGKSVSFSSDELSTFILATKANVEGTIHNEGVFGTFLGLELDTVMIRNLAIIGGVLFIVMLVVAVIAGVRHRKFLNSYNRAYRSSIYRRGVQRIPKNNTMPRANPVNKKERVKTQTKAY